MTDSALYALRYHRQRLDEPVTCLSGYQALFRQLQPVKPEAFSCPGSPPTLVHRCALGDRQYTQPMRASRRLVKGRFQGGAVGYVLSEDLPLYRSVYQKPCDLGDAKTRCLLELLEREAPLTIGQMKELTGLLVKEITPVLQKLQRAFLVYEDQADDSWERGWYLLDREFPDLGEQPPREEALRRLAVQAIRACAFCESGGLKAFLELPSRKLKQTVESLEREGLLTPCELEGRDGYVLSEDLPLLQEPAVQIPTGILPFHVSDFLVKCCAPSLQEAFSGLSVLQYLMIDGRFQGVVTGKWRQGPHDLWDIVLRLSPAEAEGRRAEILQAVERVYPHLRASGCRYCGVKIPR